MWSRLPRNHLQLISSCGVFPLPGVLAVPACAVRLDQTVFHPQGGGGSQFPKTRVFFSKFVPGQPSDRGQLCADGLWESQAGFSKAYQMASKSMPAAGQTQGLTPAKPNSMILCPPSAYLLCVFCSRVVSSYGKTAEWPFGSRFQPPVRVVSDPRAPAITRRHSSSPR